MSCCGIIHCVCRTCLVLIGMWIVRPSCVCHLSFKINSKCTDLKISTISILVSIDIAGFCSVPVEIIIMCFIALI